MTNARYDEFQLANRHRVGFQTLILVMSLIGLNGYFKASYGIWASPLLESFVLVWIPGMYFAVMSIAKNSYFNGNDYRGPFIVLLALAALMGLFSTVPFIIDKDFPLIENGQLSDRIMGLLVAIISGGISVALLIRRAANRRMLEKEE
ncbi:hypothetical protein [Sporosarcina sp. G11-34]|uniref:hypothetical protein n=1 Tax=Sporosarcina sp. G11-34 TaxID=2849605 RepID=UPI0022A98DDC|nr:hypothetical protein [Sporosarcina sp. G11-34]MCZ2259308.1 hypothetical protein [Sporosarcina sp. G11-34]